MFSREMHSEGQHQLGLFPGTRDHCIPEFTSGSSHSTLPPPCRDAATAERGGQNLGFNELGVYQKILILKGYLTRLC